MLKDQVKRRKRRSDRRHVIYRLEVNGMSYVGLTVFDRTENRSVARRFQKHVSRALVETEKKWGLCKAIRKFGADAFSLSVLQVVRGKVEAHQIERALIMKLRPTLNTDVRSKS